MALRDTRSAGEFELGPTPAPAPPAQLRSKARFHPHNYLLSSCINALGLDDGTHRPLETGGRIGRGNWGSARNRVELPRWDGGRCHTLSGRQRRSADPCDPTLGYRLHCRTAGRHPTTGAVAAAVGLARRGRAGNLFLTLPALLQVRFGRPGCALNRPTWSPVKGSSARVSPNRLSYGCPTTISRDPRNRYRHHLRQNFWTGGLENGWARLSRCGRDRSEGGFPNAGYEPHPSCGDRSLTARSRPKEGQTILKNRCRTTIAERMVETRAELPFIGDQVVCLSHDQAARLRTQERSCGAKRSPA